MWLGLGSAIVRLSGAASFVSGVAQELCQVAGAHVMMIGSYGDWQKNSPQVAWLRADISKVDRAITPWLLAVFHAPWCDVLLRR